jgi:hypothetical protein
MGIWEINANLQCEGMERSSGSVLRNAVSQVFTCGKVNNVRLSGEGKERNLLDPNPVVLRTAS